VIKFTVRRRDGVTVVGLGLSRANCERLLLDQPVPVNLRDLNLTGEDAGAVELLIFAGETEAAMADRMRRLHLIGPETVVHGEPS